MAQQEDVTIGLHSVDDFYFSALLNNDDDDDDGVTDLVPISDEKYAQQLQFQETLMASVNNTTQNDIKGSSSSSSPSPMLRFISPSSSLPSSSKAVEVNIDPKTEQIEFVTEEAGESSLIICEICAEAKGKIEMFRNKICDHSFCSDCVTKQVATKIQEGITVVSCPGLNCKGLLELDDCRSMLPKDVLDRWDDALCEALLLTVPKFYCPFKDCSAMLLDDNEGEGIRESECPFCHRLFCARCYVPWHPGVLCEVFLTLNEDERAREDLLVRELANQKKWSRCPQCKFYVEKTEGCLHITCRCKFQFCYACGQQWTSTHGGCQRN
ncbi:E3 ubiquitin-protein ligase RSL1-like [Gastrolobium bilobum]|uniref:E3 ubiquitin-protein ligase RSL1-like n=1 Tax=Gastrolobium bilobum TaxID=150636 RepID=UPI002AB265B8|nr:E3 ubiquitin-protein ligase RSL1-like [Gastrolobium bilobum]